MAAACICTCVDGSRLGSGFLHAAIDCSFAVLPKAAGQLWCMKQTAFYKVLGLWLSQLSRFDRRRKPSKQEKLHACALRECKSG